MTDKGSGEPLPVEWDVKLCKSWISDCRHFKNHYTCNQDWARKSSIFPSRLIYVGKEDEHPRPLRLHVLSTGGERQPPYITLSHCWGGANVYTLNPGTQDEMIKAIPVEKLARNFQDAIQVTRALGYSYIWIDSLCIIQNQQRKKEWEAESARDWTEQSSIMGDVYRNSDLTIAATGAMNSHVGFLKPSIGRASLDRFKESLQRGVEESPLCQRAWAFQERLLSPRMLHFGADMLFWECRTMTASEENHRGHLRGRKINERLDGKRYPTVKESVAFEDDLEEKLNLPRNPCSLGHQLYRQSQRRFLHPHLWDAADRNYNNRFSSGPIHAPRLRDMRPQQSFGRDYRSVRDPAIYSPQMQQADFRVAADDRDTGLDGFRGSFAALTSQFTALEAATWQSIAPPVNELVDNFLFHHRWYDLIGIYSAGKLTFQKDKLVAISSIANEVQKCHPDNTYVDGLWKETIHMDLLWYVKGGAGGRLGRLPTERHADNVLPSWTWASTADSLIADGLADGDMFDPQIVNMAEILDVTPSSAIKATRYGRNTGLLRLRGVVIKCKVLEVLEDGQYRLMYENGEKEEEEEEVARMYPDVRLAQEDQEDQVSIDCIGILKAEGVVKGIVVSSVSDDQGNIVYRRCGYFSAKDTRFGVSLTSSESGDLSSQVITII
ncbi:heterokaryon incompatibility protein-domain-containing protein [Cladorrhinum sp. PSN259]|nr:heterokaryon incompatibility protein-domain-containing protein [Cladorrhinum sp. PSN259]